MDILFSNLLSESILDLGKCPNRKMHESESAGFLDWALSKVQNRFQKHFSHKVLYTYCSNFFLWRVSVNIYKSKEMDFPLYFQKVI